MVRVTFDLTDDTAEYLLELFESVIDGTFPWGCSIEEPEAKVLAKDLRKAINCSKASPPPVLSCWVYSCKRGIAECGDHEHPHVNLKTPKICSHALCPIIQTGRYD